MTGFPTVVFDLDGTLVDSAPGITQTIAYTLRELSLPVPPMSDLLHWVGPPLPESFRTGAGLDEETTSRAIAIYRERYLEFGAYDSRMFDGTGAILRELKVLGRTLAIATSKPETPATLMLEHFTLAHHFDVIAAARDDETRGEKHLIIEDALAALAAKGLPTDNVVMVGDRIHDIDGAKSHGLTSVAVAWGYGTPEEWGGADHVAHTPRQLRHILGLPAPRDSS